MLAAAVEDVPGKHRARRQPEDPDPLGQVCAGLEAVQYVASRAAFGGARRRKAVVVDAAGYRQGRQDKLEREAERAAQSAVEQGRPVELESMTAQERRIVHTYLSERADVQTHSEGEDPARRLVISPILNQP